MAEDVAFFKNLIDEHSRLWTAAIMSEHRRAHRAYLTQFWGSEDRNVGSDVPPIETSHAYRHIEAIINTLYGRAPAVKVSLGVRGIGNPKISQALVNDWLSGPAREIQEMASRVALIWPFVVFKLFKKDDATDVWDKIDLTYILPWDVYVDTRAKHWHQQEYTGDRYWLRLVEAMRRFPDTKKEDWEAQDAQSVPNALDEKADRYYTFDDESIGTMVQIHEVYLPKQDRLMIYSEQYKKGTELLLDTKIPIKDFAGRVRTPYVPLMYSTDPAEPMRGYPVMRRIYDQIVEMNLDRTAMAEQVRKAARIIVAPKGVMDDHTKRAIRAGKDGTVIELDVKPEDIHKALAPLPGMDINRGLLEYGAIIGNDLTESQNTAGFTRGETTGVTATEISTLNVYTSSELGRFSRTRDESFTRLAAVYLDMLYLFVNKPDAIVLDKVTTVVTPEDIQGDFRIEVSESQSTAQARELKKQEYMVIFPMLQQLGVEPAVMLDTLIDLYELSPEHTKRAAQPSVANSPDKNALVNEVPL